MLKGKNYKKRVATKFNDLQEKVVTAFDSGAKKLNKRYKNLKSEIDEALDEFERTRFEQNEWGLYD